MIIKYKVSSKNYTPKIEKVEILRETDKCVFLPLYRGSSERRESKNSELADYFSSFDDAQSFLVDMWEKKVDYARSNLEKTKGNLGNIKGMKEPK